MNILSQVTTGKQIGPQIHVIAGVNGVGKTTWGASFPSPLILDLENGSNHLDVPRLSPDKVNDLAGFKTILNDLKGAHTYKTLVIDSVEALEGLISDFVVADAKVVSLEDVGGGFGKGFSRTREIMREIMIELRALQSKGMTIVLVAHTQVKTINDPTTNQSYDRVIMRCNDKMAALIRDLSDNVFFASYKVHTTKEKGKTKAFGDGQRVMYTQWRPGFDAKNRLDLPLELPLSYDAFAEACKLQPEANVETLTAEIVEMSKALDAQMKQVVSEQLVKFKTNPTKLKEVKTRLMKYAAG